MQMNEFFMTLHLAPDLKRKVKLIGKLSQLEAQNITIRRREIRVKEEICECVRKCTVQ